MCVSEVKQQCSVRVHSTVIGVNACGWPPYPVSLGHGDSVTTPCWCTASV